MPEFDREKIELRNRTGSVFNEYARADVQSCLKEIDRLNELYRHKPITVALSEAVRMETEAEQRGYQRGLSAAAKMQAVVDAAQKQIAEYSVYEPVSNLQLLRELGDAVRALANAPKEEVKR